MDKDKSAEGFEKKLCEGYLVKSPGPVHEDLVLPLEFKIMEKILGYEPLYRWNFNGLALFRKGDKYVSVVLKRSEENKGQIMALAIFTQDPNDTGVVTEGLLDNIRMEYYPEIDSVLGKMEFENMDIERLSNQ